MELRNDSGQTIQVNGQDLPDNQGMNAPVPGKMTLSSHTYDYSVTSSYPPPKFTFGNQTCQPTGDPQRSMSCTISEPGKYSIYVVFDDGGYFVYVDPPK